MCCGCDTFYIVSVHIQCQASIYTLSLCRGHSWRMRLAKQETLTPPWHLVSPLVCRGPWMSTVVLYCWCRSDSASILLYFTFSCVVFLLGNLQLVRRTSAWLVANANYTYTIEPFDMRFLLSPRNSVEGDIVTRPFVCGWVSEWVGGRVRMCVRHTLPCGHDNHYSFCPITFKLHM